MIKKWQEKVLMRQISPLNLAKSKTVGRGGGCLKTEEKSNRKGDLKK